MTRWTLATAALLLVAGLVAPAAAQDKISIGYLVGRAMGAALLTAPKDMATSTVRLSAFGR